MRRALLPTAFGLIAGLSALWVLSATGSADTSRQKPEPVHARNISVEGIPAGSRPAHAQPPRDLPARRDGVDEKGESGKGRHVPNGEAEPADQKEITSHTTVLDAGIDLNLMGAVGRRVGSENGKDPHVGLRTSLDGKLWSEWLTLTLESAPEEVSVRRLVADPCWLGTARYVEFLRRGDIEDLKLPVVNSLGETSLVDQALEVVRKLAVTCATFLRAEEAVATAGKPAIVSRSQRGAKESLRRADPGIAPVKMAFVHQTAGGNSYSRSHAPAVVRAIYRYHVQGAGSNDLGCNFLIDSYGTIDDGRQGGIKEGVIGAHALGFNTSSTGVALMGTVVLGSPSSAALASLKYLLAWKLDVHHVNPTGSGFARGGA